MRGIKVLAPAKVNLGLAVLNRRSDGYHNIDSVFALIDLFDTVNLYPRTDMNIVVKCQHPDVPLDENNLAWKAADLVRQELNIAQGVTIEIIKRIPIGGGLAGGSTDAAAVLNGIPILWNKALTMGDRAKLGQTLGADVSFCVQGGIKRGVGTGVDLSDIPYHTQLRLAILPQPFMLSTRRVYQLWDDQGNNEMVEIDKIVSTLMLGDYEFLASLLGNNLEKPAFSLRPELGLIKSQLHAQGIEAIMSGSGATMFVPLTDHDTFSKLKSCYDGLIIKSKVLKTLPQVEII